jgi:ATP-binding cassette subfamily B protein
MNIFDLKSKIGVVKLLRLGLYYRPGYFLLFVVFSIFTGLVTPFVIKLQTYFIDFSTSRHTGSWIGIIVPSLIGYFMINLCDFSSQNIFAFWNFKISNGLEKKIMPDYIYRMSKLKYEEYENPGTQDIIFRLEQTLLQVSAQGVNFVPTILRHAIELMGILYFIVISGVWWIFPTSIILSIPSFYFNKKRVQYARKVWEKDNADMRYSDYLHGILVNREGAKERKLFQYTDFLGSWWDFVFKKYNKNKMIDYWKSSVATGIAMFFSMSNIVVFGLFLLRPLQNNMITIGLYVSLLQMITNRFNFSINTIIREITNLTQIKKLTQDLDDFKKLQCVETAGNKENVEFQSLRFDNVYFHYPNTDRFILNGVSFEIRKGMQYALIGLNGAGKTTITKLMMGLYAPTGGHIFINDIDIMEYSYDQLRNIFVCMQQELVMYKMTARENISLFRLNDKMNDELLDKTLKTCGLSASKSLFRNNYDTNLTPELEGGVALSGGESQKISIARSVFAEREFYILDEPTAALDPLAEVEFYRNYKSLIKDQTCLYITHRLGSTFLFNKCILLNNGIIAETGSHDELMNISDGLYKTLYDKQKAWYETGEKDYDAG